MRIFYRLDEEVESWLQDEINGVAYMLVNGELEPSFSMESGVFKRFR